MNKSQYTRECLLKHPCLISKLIKDKSFDPKITKGILFGMIPFRSSIEIECFKSLSKIKNKLDREMKQHYDVYDYSDDHNNIRSKEICEHRISIMNYSQAAGLYKILQDMKKYCKLNPESGIHVHIDAWKIANRNFLRENMHEQKVYDFLYSKLNELEDIFGEYKGEYNTRDVYFQQRGSWINVQYEQFGSIEFRIGTMTFDYETIIMWIIKCNKIVKELYRTLKVSY